MTNLMELYNEVIDKVNEWPDPISETAIRSKDVHGHGYNIESIVNFPRGVKINSEDEKKYFLLRIHTHEIFKNPGDNEPSSISVDVYIRDDRNWRQIKSIRNLYPKFREGYDAYTNQLNYFRGIYVKQHMNNFP